MKTIILAFLLTATASASSDCVPNNNSTGQAARLETVDPSTWSADRLPPSRMGILIYSGAVTPPIPFGDGVLCLHPLHLQRGPVSLTPASGVVVGPRLPEYSGLSAQYLFRDGEGSWNLSNLQTL